MSIKSEKSTVDRLSIHQIKLIENLQLEPISWLGIARDTFLFSFYNAGIRFGDLARLRWSHVIDGRLKYKMSKTGTGKNIMLLAPAKEILEKFKSDNKAKDSFIFPLLNATYLNAKESVIKRKISSMNVIVNKNLKKIAKLTGIEENIAFHIARHSFADYARSMNMNLYDISKALGHSDIVITQRYLKSFDETSLDESMKKLFE